MDCGFVIDARIIGVGPEWRVFDEEEGDRRARAGAPVRFAIHDEGLSTDIDKADRDA